MDGADVPAGAQAVLPRAGEDDRGDAGVVLPGGELRVDGAHHRVGEGVERLGPVEDEVTGAALPAEPHAAHRNASVSPRATMTRMISLLPSRIWWTRRSRTIFSMPYSLR